jgi:hypothetical protein
LEGKCLFALTSNTGYPSFDKPCKKTFLGPSSSSTSESGIDPFGTNEALHFCHSTNNFAAFAGSIDLEIKNLISVGSPYVCKCKPEKSRTVKN